MRRGLCIKPNLIRITYAILTGLFIAICSEDELLYKGFHEIGCIRLFLLWLTCIGIILIVFGAFDLLKKWIIAYKMNERYNSISLSIAILVIAWLPYMIIFSPGIMHWDTMIQIQDFHVNNQY